MDQEKMGKLIAKLRKEKKLTQEELGQKLGVNNKTVSKWECGLTTPDISIINALADELGITTRELLLGKKEISVTDSKNITKKIDFTKKNVRFLIFFLIFLLIVLNIILIIFVHNNYNKYGYIKFSLNNKSFYSEGYVISQKNKELVFLKDLIYQSVDKGTNKELKINKLKISIINGDKVIFNYTFNEQYDDNGNIKNYYISDLLENFSIIVNENKKDSNRIKINKDRFIMFLEYNTNDGEKIHKKYKLSIMDEEYNNRWFK